MDDFLNQIEKIQLLMNGTDKYDDKLKRISIPQGMVKELLIRSKGKCQKCKTSLTGLKPDLHHKNQNPSDNRLQNIDVLCPNCHRKAHYNKDGTKTAPRKKSKPSDMSIDKDMKMYIVAAPKNKMTKPTDKKDLLNKLSKSQLKKVVKALDPEYYEYWDGNEKEDYIKTLLSLRKATVKRIQEIVN